jgi:hypothetical protein
VDKKNLQQPLSLQYIYKINSNPMDRREWIVFSSKIQVTTSQDIDKE